MKGRAIKMIRKAKFEDLKEVMNIIDETIEDLSKEGNKQWSKSYPTVNHFKNDLEHESLYVYIEDSHVAGVISLNQNENNEYKDANWQKKKNAIVIHRFAISREYQRRKIGTKLVGFAEDMAIEKNLNYIKVDTNSKNKKMNMLFRKLNYHFCGEIHMGGLNDPFNCYDKVLNK